MVERRRRPKFKMHQYVRLFFPFMPWGLEGEYMVLGWEDRPGYEYCYLLENIKNPYHPILWVAESAIGEAEE